MLPNIERTRAGKQDHPREAVFLLNFPQKLAIVLNYGKERRHDNIEMRLWLFHTTWGRIKSAMTILFGKPVYYSDVYINDPKKFREFVEKLNKLCLVNENDK